MSNPVDARALVPRAMDRFTGRVRAVAADAWDAPTPCTEWSVRDLVAHLCSEHHWAPHILAGQPMDQVGDRYDGDLVGTDPVDGWAAAVERSRPEWTATDAHADPVHVSFGWLSVAEYAEQMLLDLTVHEWDLARGAGLDDALDPECVDRALTYVHTDPVMLTGPGMFAAAVAPRSSAAHDELLAAVGRR